MRSPQRYRSGDRVTCVNCNKTLSVTLFDENTFRPMPGTAMHDLVLACQTCEAVLCHPCSKPAGGSGMAFCPICKTDGGPFFITG